VSNPRRGGLYWRVAARELRVAWASGPPLTECSSVKGPRAQTGGPSYPHPKTRVKQPTTTDRTSRGTLPEACGQGNECAVGRRAGDRIGGPGGYCSANPGVQLIWGCVLTTSQDKVNADAKPRWHRRLAGEAVSTEQALALHRPGYAIGPLDRRSDSANLTRPPRRWSIPQVNHRGPHRHRRWATRHPASPPDHLIN